MNEPKNPIAGAHTYAELKNFGLKKMEERGASKGIRNNHQTALNSWWKHLGLSESSQVGDELTVSFDRSWTRVSDELRLEDKSPRTIQDRCELMLRWREIHQQMLSTDTLPAGFAEALSECMRRAGATTGDIERSTGVSLQKVRQWQTGLHRPTSGSLGDVAAIEKALGLEPQTLSSRLPRATSIKAALRAMQQEGTTTSTAYGHRMRAIHLQRLKYIRQPEGQLLCQWREVMAYKSDFLREGVRGRDVWRIGWLSLERAKGGAGIEPARTTAPLKNHFFGPARPRARKCIMMV